MHLLISFKIYVYFIYVECFLFVFFWTCKSCLFVSIVKVGCLQILARLDITNKKKPAYVTQIYLKFTYSTFWSQIKSRHVLSESYYLWVHFVASNKKYPIKHSIWYCQCKSSARLFDWSTYVVSVLWYIGFQCFRFWDWCFQPRW